MSFDSLPFVWTAEVFGTNHAQMDEEHAGLFAAIDKLDAERTPAAFESLAGLVITHFADEEAAAPLPPGHLQAHKDLLSVATAKLGELKSGAASVDDGLVTYLKNWLKNHIKGNDIPTYGK
eukprot:gene9648-10667_t